MHRYAEEIRADNLALSLAPDLYVAALFKGWSYARWQGQLDTLRAVVRTVPMDASLGPLGSGAAQRSARGDRAAAFPAVVAQR